MEVIGFMLFLFGVLTCILSHSLKDEQTGRNNIQNKKEE